MAKILCVGPKSKPLTGQSYAFNAYVNNSSQDIDVLYNSGGNKYLSPFIFMCSLLYKFVFFRYDVVYFTSSRTKVGFIRDFILIILFSRKCKVINHLHGADFIDFRESCCERYQKIIDFTYGKVSSSIVLTKGMMEQYSKYPQMKIYTVPNFYEKESVGVESNRLENLRNKSFKVIFLSNLIPEKGLVELIEAIVLLRTEKNHDVSLSIVGADLGYNELSSYVRGSCNKYDYISYEGTLFREEKAMVLSCSHFFVLPTYYPTEAQPISIIEGMANGCVIITTEHNYLPELISKKNGSLIKKKDIQALSVSLEGYFNDVNKILNVSSYNREYASIEFSIDAYINSLDVILSST
ncbi:hypothetical protein C9J12_02935 [Photobacterium frigidiphilum]|uniref:Glycosyl transferase family 1 domain-containing protein n=1 Tax=Photobacterium frigidiphilum TaxID=264736 RepID=A0A2T3JPH2_9GAMM|nr:glycosyltransferase family 4 protein [Photobacterium frigidiphilum]PSU50938.1 hypothetical protein C9J12_02935 [Photobacterium frigidiphilum]